MKKNVKRGIVAIIAGGLQFLLLSLPFIVLTTMGLTDEPTKGTELADLADGAALFEKGNLLEIASTLVTVSMVLAGVAIVFGAISIALDLKIVRLFEAIGVAFVPVLNIIITILLFVFVGKNSMLFSIGWGVFVAVGVSLVVDIIYSAFSKK